MLDENDGVIEVNYYLNVYFSSYLINKKDYSPTPSLSLSITNATSSSNSLATP